MSASKFYSGIIAISYILFVWLWFTGSDALLAARMLVIPLGFIWFSELLGQASGSVGLGSKQFTEETPAIVVEIGGWFLLFVLMASKTWILFHMPPA